MRSAQFVIRDKARLFADSVEMRSNKYSFRRRGPQEMEAFKGVYVYVGTEFKYIITSGISYSFIRLPFTKILYYRHFYRLWMEKTGNIIAIFNSQTLAIRDIIYAS